MLGVKRLLKPKKAKRNMKSVTETLPSTNVVKRGVGRPKTKVTLKRVVLLDGQPVGRGRPVKGSKTNRTYVFIPVDETYDLTSHGVGAQYRAGRSQAPIKRVNIGSYRKFVNLPTISPTAAVEVLSDIGATVTVADDKF